MHIFLFGLDGYTHFICMIVYLPIWVWWLAFRAPNTCRVRVWPAQLGGWLAGRAAILVPVRVFNECG